MTATVHPRKEAYVAFPNKIERLLHGCHISNWHFINASTASEPSRLGVSGSGNGPGTTILGKYTAIPGPGNIPRSKTRQHTLPNPQFGPRNYNNDPQYCAQDFAYFPLLYSIQWLIKVE